MSRPEKQKLAGPAAVAEVQDDDPIFAAIERHKAAWRGFMLTCDLADEVRAQQEGREVTEADTAAYEAASCNAAAAFEALIGTVPTSTAGARAAVAYLVEYDHGCVPQNSGRYLATLLRSPVLQAEALS